ncbi:MAG: branched-chain amino acid ABC transporter permease [Gemmatimonadales bacterium]|nr:branched-chain amino acid ABC transporter permease [Gemmatimonadales bacterium]
MSLETLAIQAAVGLVNAMLLFLVASGLSLIFGVSRIINFAHGSFYMLGAYGVFAMTQLAPGRPGWLLLAVGVAALGVAAAGTLVETTFLRRVYASEELFQLLATFAVVLAVSDAVKIVWGSQNKSLPLPPFYRQTTTIFGQPFPVYYFLVLLLAGVVMVGLWFLVYRTGWGIRVRACTDDRDMANAIGINQRRFTTTVFLLGSGLAGLGGVCAAIMGTITPIMDSDMLVEAFVVVVVGGLGSLLGSFVAALVVGELKAIAILFFPRSSMVIAFLLMAVILIVKPSGLFGAAEE